MNKKEINFGFIGTGKVAFSSAKSVDRHERASVIAAQDLSLERTEQFCRETGVGKACKTAEELLSLKEVDAVYIAVPNKFHAPLAIQALEAGKHVILEKPFAMNYKEATQVVEKARSSGLQFMVGMNQRYVKDAQKVKSLVEKGIFGEIYHAKAFWFRRSGIPRLGTWFGNRALAGAGCLYDIGVHLLDLCLYLSDKFDPVSVTASTYTKFGHRGLGEGTWNAFSDKDQTVFDVDDFATGLIKFADGSSVTLDVSWACHMETGNRNDVVLYGTEAGASVYPAKLFQYGADPGDYKVENDFEAEIALPHADRFHNFINALRHEEELIVKMEESLVVQKILDGMARSSSTGREVRLDK